MTKKRWFVSAAVLTGWLAMVAGGEGASVVQELIARYERIETVICDVRRDVVNEHGRIRWLSRVHYQRPDRLHVENFAPLPRRIIADGQWMHQHNEGHPRGFRRSIDTLNEAMLYGLRKVPGTAMDHLYRLVEAEEQVLEGTGDYPRRYGYLAGPVYAELFMDDEYRLGKMRLYDAEHRSRPTGEIHFEAFEEVLEGVWIPMVHRGRFTLGGVESTETIRISGYVVNEPIAAHLFDAEAFIDDVRWVDEFDDL